jgi:hypothetical protein
VLSQYDKANEAAKDRLTEFVRNDSSGVLLCLDEILVVHEHLVAAFSGIESLGPVAQDCGCAADFVV